MHVRTQLRNALRQRLVDSVESVGGRVFDREYDPDFNGAAFPKLRLAMVSSSVTSDQASDGSRAREVRTFNVEVVIFTDRQNDEDDEIAEDALEGVAIEVEAALGDYRSLPIRLIEMPLTGDECRVYAADSSPAQLTGLALKYAATVDTRHGGAETSLHRS